MGCAGHWAGFDRRGPRPALRSIHGQVQEGPEAGGDDQGGRGFRDRARPPGLLRQGHHVHPGRLVRVPGRHAARCFQGQRLRRNFHVPDGPAIRPSAAGARSAWLRRARHSFPGRGEVDAFARQRAVTTTTTRRTTLTERRSAPKPALRAPRASKLLIISPKAGSMTPEIQERLRTEFADHLILEFDPDKDFEKLITPRATVVVAGGDGTVEFIVRKLADSKHPIGILSLGTFNNFARALGLPPDLDKAIEVARSGRPRAITLGRVNGHIFLEACAIGLFGETIALGDSAKDMEFGKLGLKLKDVIGAKPFQYELTGDIEGSGTAMSLVFSNTPSTGSKLPVSDATPIEPYLEFSVHAGRTRTDIVGRALAGALLNKHQEDTGQVFKFKRLEVKTTPRVRVYADNLMVGRTPATVTAEVSAVKVMLPR